MNTGKSKTPAPSASADSWIDWRRVVSTACLKCDWTKLAQAALGSTDLAAMVGQAFRLIGESIEHDLARAGATSAADAAVSPPTDEAQSHEVDDNGNLTDKQAPPSEAEANANPDAPPPVVDEQTARAAALLGVDANASEDEVRAALRSLLSSSRVHPDHGGDGEQAKRLIAAKNLLVERARAVRS